MSRVRRGFKLAFAVFFLVLPASAAAADVRGREFTARTACPAFQSFRKGTNPGGETVNPGVGYEIREANGSDPTHYRIVLPGAEPQLRWVAKECGTLGEADIAAPETTFGDASSLIDDIRAGKRGEATDLPSDARGEGLPVGSYVLALNWHAAFCERNSRASECRSGGADDGLKLHGLWPQPRGHTYCGVSTDLVSLDERGRWLDLPAIELDGRTRARLEAAMPGVSDGLHRHEWYKHGTCSGVDAETYFAGSLALLRQVNASAVGELLRTNVREGVTSDGIRRAFDAAFGNGAGRRVTVDCSNDGGRVLLSELRIHVEGSVAGKPDLGQLIGDAATAPRGCPVGMIDPSGPQ